MIARWNSFDQTMEDMKRADGGMRDLGLLPV